MIRNISIVWLTFALVLVQAPPKEANVHERNPIRSSLDRLAQDPVIVKVGVLNEETGGFVPNLRAEDFVIEEDGKRQQPTRFLREERPLSILLMIDSSGSMRLIIQAIIDAVSNGLKRLKPDDEVALMSFNQELDILQDFTKNKGLVEEKLRGVVARGQTLTRQALFHAAKHMLKATAADSRRVIVVLTDNRSTRGDVSEKVVMQQLSASGSVVCGVIVSNDSLHDLRPPNAPASGRPYPPPPGSFTQATDDITPYVDETGGTVETLVFLTGALFLGAASAPVKPEEISARLVKIIDAFRNYYRIEYLSTNSKRDGEHRKIKLTLSPGVKKSGSKLRVLAKRGYYAPDLK